MKGGFEGTSLALTSRFVLAILAATLLCGCRSTRQTEAPSGPHVRVLTYNVNWGAPQPDLTADIIRQSGADVVCLQETTPEWERFLRQSLADDYPFMEFRQSKGRSGGGLGFLSKTPGNQVAYIPSETGWFDGWIVRFDTPIGPIQFLNVHLRPPISDSGSWVSGYFSTKDDRQTEMERFYNARATNLPTVVLGDFNDGEHSPVVNWLLKKGMIDALHQFDHHTPTWQWQTSVFTLSRRMDHIIYEPDLDCRAARVIAAGASDHFPVEAVLTKAD